MSKLKGRRAQTDRSKVPYAKPTKDAATKKPTKSMTKSSKFKDESLTDQLDGLMGDLSSHLTKKKKKNEKAPQKTKAEVEAAQAVYEKTQNDMEAALGLLTRL
ncbi:hypothetical protein PHYBLDRAFT_169560 [Phycomyces blakesleeanus NRRL 1555(-)]|uniref:Uncharacterized protein n=1 Tax=Phycomyces blakesleeanus (strain ATCC 8743b / DSM 1359 / FGSC 10004 / NBRC 33097 / NRRL 1555) TaxID=763407 RepID=A0A167MC54_PHYB8|nr:hypothetical protein PHYBLDRAFT_169560 [Phycomyces blakesleeanus NRRL 1555(-)]OAD72434.1 hypothetical protein PHYBLDRAFT_169560 [Phycomyces blakesleeanus NRRL 1555(-)]|eukprot:XP_018290474.1 hypothetical protein PHYBLDRAFT_169560 [Phycomyces blakesleeanus NRRL 1555(-)]